MKIVLRIKRFLPGTDAAPYDRDYEVEVEPTDRVLDALLKVKSSQDGSLSFRSSCAHGVCGSDAMIIQGKERLACKTLVRDVAEETGRHREPGAAAAHGRPARPDGGPGEVLRKLPLGEAVSSSTHPRGGEGAPAEPEGNGRLR